MSDIGESMIRGLTDALNFANEEDSISSDPAQNGFSNLLESLRMFSDDFMQDEREQPPVFESKSSEE